MTLDDLERPILTAAEKKRFTELTIKIWTKIDPYYQRQNIGLKGWLKGIRGCSLGFCKDGASNDSGVTIYNLQPLDNLSVIPKCMTLNDPE